MELKFESERGLRGFRRLSQKIAHPRSWVRVHDVRQTIRSSKKAIDVKMQRVDDRFHTPRAIEIDSEHVGI